MPTRALIGPDIPKIPAHDAKKLERETIGT